MWFRVATAILVVLGVVVVPAVAQEGETSLEDGRPQNWVELTTSQTPSTEDYLPQNLAVTRSEDGSSLTVNWDAPTRSWNDEEHIPYWVRYRYAGSKTYVDYIFDPGASTEYTLYDCRSGTGSAILGSAGVACNVPIQPGKSYIVEVAQRTKNFNPNYSVPTQTDADWAKTYVDIPMITAGAPTVTGISVEYYGSPFADLSHPAGESNASEGNDWGTVIVRTDSTPAADASVELIWDELAGTGNGERADILMVNYPDTDTGNPDAAVIRWHLENDQNSINLSGKQRVFGAPDSLLEEKFEIANLRLANFNGIDPDGSVKTVDVTIEDRDRSTVSLHVITANASSVGVVEEVSDIEIRASLSNAIDSRCELSWSAEFAATDEESLTKLEGSDFDPLVSASGVFVFEAGERRSTQFWSVADDGVPEGLETLRFSTSSIDCVHTYTPWLISGVQRSVDIKIRASDVPVVSSVVAGDADGVEADRKATVNWDLGGADESEISGFVVRWVPEVTGEDDAFYLTGDNVTWETLAVGSASARSVLFPAVGRLDAGTVYVVQVGVVTEVGVDPVFSDVLSRVTTASATMSVVEVEVFEGESFEVSVVLSEVLSEDVSIEVSLASGSGSDAAEADDFVAGPQTITIVAGETTGSVSFSTTIDDDADDESLVLSASVALVGVVLSPVSIELSIAELLDAPPPTGISVAAGDGATTAADADRRFRVDWSAPSGVTVGSYQVGWIVKPGDGSVPADSDWMMESVPADELGGVFPSGSALYRASNTAESGVGLEAGGVYLVRVRSVVENGRLVWSEPMEVTLEDPILVLYAVDAEQIIEGGTVTLAAILSSPLSEDVEVTWGVVTGESSDAVAGEHTAEADDVTIASPATETLVAGQTMLSKEFLANADTDSDEDVFSPFVIVGADIEGVARPLVTITELGLSGGGGSNEPTQDPSTQPLTMQTTNSQTSVPPNTQPAGSGGQPANPGGGNTGTLPIVGGGGGGSGLPATVIPPMPGTGDQVQSSAGGFIDTVGTTHEDNIDRLAAGGITRGCNPPSNTRFCPGRAVTRGEMATFMVRAFDLSSSGSDLFGDDDGNTHEGNINALAVAEITRGCNPPENSRYCPDRPVTRAQMATFLARAMELAEGSGEFTDTADSPHANDINRIASVGITRGCNPPSNSRFCPDRAVTRGEMATFLIRAEDLET